MNKLRPSFLGTVLVVAFAAAPATMAEDFHALSQMSTGFTAMPEDQLASIEGGRVCVRGCKTSVRVFVSSSNTSTNTNTATASITTNNPAIPPAPPAPRTLVCTVTVGPPITVNCTL